MKPKGYLINERFSDAAVEGSDLNLRNCVEAVFEEMVIKHSLSEEQIDIIKEEYLDHHYDVMRSMDEFISRVITVANSSQFPLRMDHVFMLTFKSFMSNFMKAMVVALNEEDIPRDALIDLQELINKCSDGAFNSLYKSCNIKKFDTISELIDELFNSNGDLENE